MATAPMFTRGMQDYPERLNDLTSVLIPRRNGANVSANTQLLDENNGEQIDCTAALTLTFAASTLIDGWSVIVNAISGGTVTLTAPFVDGTNSKTITVGNSAIVSCNGTQYRIFRGVAT